jgi:preprotein translocase subunit SecD
MKDEMEKGKVEVSYECNRIRAGIETDKFIVKQLQEAIHELISPLNEAREEMYENAVLAYRHLEDARMRIGKVLQHLQGGVSIYDRQEDNKASVAPEGGDECRKEEMSDEAIDEVLERQMNEMKKEEMAKNAALIEAAKKKTDVASPKVSREGEEEAVVQKPCVVCGEETFLRVVLNGDDVPLCDHHRTVYNEERETKPFKDRVFRQQVLDSIGCDPLIRNKK